MSKFQQDKKLDQGTVRKIFNYLFGKDKLDEHQYMDMRTSVKGREMFGALVFFRVLDEHYKCKTAQKVAGIIERILVSDTRLGRTEAVQVLMTPSMPKEIRIETGIDPMFKKRGDGKK